MLSLIVTSYQSESLIAGFSYWIYPIIEKFDKIVIVDDASTDLSQNLLQNNFINFENVKLIFREINSGRPSVPRNQGLASLSDIGRVVFLDIDDRLPYHYIDFLCSLNNDSVCYSGVKFVCDIENFNPCFLIDFRISRHITSSQLSCKNHIVFSGSSLPVSTAKKHIFKNLPLEDWMYWQEVINEDNLVFKRLLNVPIAYDGKLSLSPRKYRQILRVYKKISYRILFYFFGFLRLKFEERRLKDIMKNLKIT